MLGSSAEVSQRPLKDVKGRSESRNKFTKDRDGDYQRERNTMNNGRRKDEVSDKWVNSRSRRVTQSESNKSTKDEDRYTGLYDNRQEFDSKETNFRKGVIGRGKLDQRWSRDHNQQTSRDGDRPNLRGHGWRDRDWQEEKDWSKVNKAEQDPEWLDETQEEEKKQVHTQEDFQLWKERMRAGTIREHSTKSDNISTSAESATPQNAVLQPLLSGGFDKLLGKWTDVTKSEDAIDSGINLKAQSQKSKSSRFAGFFAPQEDNREAVPEANAPMNLPSQKESSDDKEGFQRILQMLGSVNISSENANQQLTHLSSETSTSGVSGPQSLGPGRLAASVPYLGRSEKNAISNNPETRQYLDEISGSALYQSSNRSAEPTAHQNISFASPLQSFGAVLSDRKNSSLENKLGTEVTNQSRSRHVHRLDHSRENFEVDQNRDSEFLLNLMHQSRFTSHHGAVAPSSGMDMRSPSHAYSTINHTPDSNARNFTGVLLDDRSIRENTKLGYDASITGDITKSLSRLPPGLQEGSSGLARRLPTEQFFRNPATTPHNITTDYLPQKQDPISYQQDRGLPPPNYGAVSQYTRYPPGVLPQQHFPVHQNLRGNGGPPPSLQGQGPLPMGSHNFYAHNGGPIGFPPGRS